MGGYSVVSCLTQTDIVSRRRDRRFHSYLSHKHFRLCSFHVFSRGRVVCGSGVLSVPLKEINARRTTECVLLGTCEPSFGGRSHACRHAER